MKTKNFFFLLLLFYVAIASSCGEDDAKETFDSKKNTKKNSVENVKLDLSMQNDVVSFISNQENVFLYGSLKTNELLNKIYYNSEFKNSSIFKKDQDSKKAIAKFEEFKSYFNFGIPLSFVFKGSSDQDLEIILMGGIKNREDLINAIDKETTNNKDVEQEGKEMTANNFETFEDFKFFRDKEGFLAMTKDKFIFSFKQNRNSISPTDIDAYFDDFKGEKDETIQAVLNDSKDLTVGYDMNKIIEFGLNNKTTKDVAKRESGIDVEVFEKNMREIFDFKGSFDLAFDNGSMGVEWKIFKSGLWNKVMKNDSKPILKKLGKGNPVAGILANIDVSTLSKMFYESYPQGVSQFIAEFNKGSENDIPKELGMIDGFLKNGGLESFFEGEVGLVLYNIPDQKNLQLTNPPEFSAYLGIGDNLKKIINEQGGFEVMENLLPIYDISLNYKNRGVSLHSRNHSPGAKGLNMSNKFSHIGRKPLSFFLDLEYLVKNAKAMSIGAKQRKLVELFDFVDMEADMKGGHFTIHLKDKSINSLSLLINKFIEVADESIVSFSKEAKELAEEYDF